jgi:uncharacterized membrane protein (DUF4010 family)
MPDAPSPELVAVSAAWIRHAAGLGVAAAAGLVVGMERERSGKDKEHRRFAGVRTLALVGLAGGLAGVLGGTLGAWVPVAYLLAIGALSVAASRMDAAHPGVTTEVSTLAVALMGVLATTELDGVQWTGRLGLVGASALVVTGLLSLRGPLHRLADAISPDEMLQVAQLGLLLLVVLPMLPDLDLWGIAGLNPHETGLMVALIAGIGFSGYLAVRLMGPGRGMALAGLMGGLVSSTAVTLGFAARCKEQPDLARAASRGIVLACAVMLPRQLLEVGVVAPGLLPRAAIPLGVMGAVGVLAAAATLLRNSDPPTLGDDRIRNPSSMGEALKFGALYAVVVAVSGQAHRWLGPEGLYVSSVLAGVADVDAITLSVGRLMAEGLDGAVAARALTLAAITNTLVKLGLAAVLGGRRLGLSVAVGLVPMVVAGAVAAWFV